MRAPPRCLAPGCRRRCSLRALALVRGLTGARIWARDGAKAAALAARLEPGFPVTVAATVEDAVAGADVIVTTTPATAPILPSAFVTAGQHVTAMGSDAEHKNEVDPALIARARYVADRLSQTARLGELHHAIAAGLAQAGADHPELGQVVAGLVPGRTDAAQITLADLTGTGIQDTAIAALALTRARAAGAGQSFKV
ncbi:ectoine utilization protein EutC [Frigidibacter albus]